MGRVRGNLAGEWREGFEAPLWVFSSLEPEEALEIYRDMRAFRWVNGAMRDLGTLSGRSSWAYDVSADSSVVVGWAGTAQNDQRAFRWTPTGGMEDLNLTYAHLLKDGSKLLDARAVSPDGR